MLILENVKYFREIVKTTYFSLFIFVVFTAFLKLLISSISKGTEDSLLGDSDLETKLGSKNKDIKQENIIQKANQHITVTLVHPKHICYVQSVYRPSQLDRTADSEGG